MLANSPVWLGKQRGGTIYPKTLCDTNPSLDAMYPWNRQQPARPHSGNMAGGSGGGSASNPNAYTGLPDPSAEVMSAARGQQPSQQLSPSNTTPLSSVSSSAVPFAYHPSPNLSSQQPYDGHTRSSSVASNQHDFHRPHSAGHFGAGSSTSRFPSSSPYAESAYTPTVSNMGHAASPVYPHPFTSPPTANDAANTSIVAGYGQFSFSGTSSTGGGGPAGHYTFGPHGSSSAPAEQSYPSSSTALFYGAPYEHNAGGSTLGSTELSANTHGFPPPGSAGGMSDRELHTSSSTTSSHQPSYLGGGGAMTSSASSSTIVSPTQHGYMPYGTTSSFGYPPHIGSSGGGGQASVMTGGLPGYHAYHSSQDPYDQRIPPQFFNPYEVKHRRRTTRSQFKLLESTFKETPKPSAATRKAISKQLDMPLRAVQIWFQNRRAKAKNQAKKGSGGESSGPSGQVSALSGGGEGITPAADALTDNSEIDESSSTGLSAPFAIDVVPSKAEGRRRAGDDGQSSGKRPISDSDIASMQQESGDGHSIGSYDVFKVPHGRYRSFDATMSANIPFDNAQHFAHQAKPAGLHTNFAPLSVDGAGSQLSPVPLTQAPPSSRMPPFSAASSQQQPTQHDDEPTQRTEEAGAGQQPFWRY